MFISVYDGKHILKQFRRYPFSKRSFLMKENDKIKQAAAYILLFVTVAILGITLAFNTDRITAIIGYIVGALMPVLIGAVIAYLLYPAVNFFEGKVFSKMIENGKRKSARALSVTLSFALLLIVLVLIGSLLIPQLIINSAQLAGNVEHYIKYAEQWADGFIDGSDIFKDTSTLSQLLGDKKLSDFLAGVLVDSLLFADRFVNFVILAASGLVDFAVNAVFTVICAFGIMFYKDKILSAFNRVGKAFLSDKPMSAIKVTVRAVDRAFGGFFSGRIFESLIIGVLALIIFYITGMPYPPLLAVILAVFNLIPYFGSIFAGVVGGVIVFVAEPSMVIWFLIIDLIMEQIDGNILAPRVLGDSIGIHPLCIIVSITVMGSLMGVMGLIVGVPIAALFIDFVKYICSLFEAAKKKRNREKEKGSEVSANEGI